LLGGVVDWCVRSGLPFEAQQIGAPLI
jgi:hypothetical protein